MPSLLDNPLETSSTSIDLEENDLKPNPADFQETAAAGGEWSEYYDDKSGSPYWYNKTTGESSYTNPYDAAAADAAIVADADGSSSKIPAWTKELFYLSLALLMLGTVVRASIQLFDHQDINTCQRAAWNQNVYLPLLLVFIFWVVPAAFCLLVIPVLIFSVYDTFRSGGASGGGGGGCIDRLPPLKCNGNSSGGGEAAAVLVLALLFMPLYFFAGGISSTVILFSNQWAPPLPDFDMPSPPLMELYHSQCEDIPPILNATWLGTHGAALVSTGSVAEGDLSALGLVTQWVSVPGWENADEYRRTFKTDMEEECKRLGSTAWAGAEFVPLEVKGGEAARADIAAKMAVRAPFCTRDATKNTFTYVEN